jgi:hypothetical protein
VHAGPEVRRRVGGRPSRLHGGTLPVIEVRDDGDIFIDGKLLIGTVRWLELEKKAWCREYSRKVFEEKYSRTYAGN